MKQLIGQWLGLSKPAPQAQSELMPQPKKATAFDSLTNTLTGLAGRLDPERYNRFQPSRLISPSELTSLYVSSGVARNMVEAHPHEAFKDGLECATEIEQEFGRLEVIPRIIELSSMARLYGGACMVIIAKDGNELPSAELNINNLKRIEKLVVYDNQFITPEYQNLGFDSISNPEFYRLNNGQNSIVVHKSRIIRMDGDYLPLYSRFSNNGWGSSALQPMYESLFRLMSSVAYTSALAKRFGTNVVKVAGLFDAFLNGNEEAIAKRLNDTSASLSAYNILIMDSESEDAKLESPNVTGFRDLIMTQMEMLSGDSKIPMSILFGRAPEGMNATGDKDIERWYAEVEKYRNYKLAPVLNQITTLLMAQTEWQNKPEEAQWSFIPLRQLDAKGQAEVRKVNAEADAVYINAGAVNPAYVFHQRHDGGYHGELNYSEESLAEYEATQDPGGEIADDEPEESEEDTP